MIPILSTTQVRAADAFTIENEPISSLNLMERASRAFVKKFNTLSSGGKEINIFCGTGNNGGDGLVIARVLAQQAHVVNVFVVGNLEKASPDFKANYERLGPLTVPVLIHSTEDIPIIKKQSIVIDGLFGSGLSRPVEGLFAKVIQKINASESEVFSIDIPSGLFGDKPNTDGSIIKSNHTITFQTPNLGFCLPENQEKVGEWHIVDIGLDREFIDKQETAYYFTEQKDIVIPFRNKFDHKGSAGRMLLVAGSKGKMGAAILSARAAIRAGCGLLFVHTPCCGLNVLQVSVPEAMVVEDEHTEVVSEVLPEDNIDVVVIGPGIGTGSLTSKALSDLILQAQAPMVLDADAINILSENSSLIEALPAESVLTPHPGEFKRLVGDWKNGFEKLDLLRNFCVKHQLNMVLKGAYSAVCNVKGEVYFNPSGNPGMATGGSGDVLTGIVGALIAQKISPGEALKTAVFLHGLSGDLAAEQKGHIGLIASDLIEFLPKALMKISK
ncbi:MAG: NAD(P)H-hydrate dehydratase [Marinoscillum sp.]